VQTVPPLDDVLADPELEDEAPEDVELPPVEEDDEAPLEVALPLELVAPPAVPGLPS
jgi:hypothetical protein